MNSLRFSGSSVVDTCSAETMVPWMTRMSTPGVEDHRGQRQGVLRGDPHRHRAAAGAQLAGPARRSAPGGSARRTPPAAAWWRGASSSRPASSSRTLRRVLVPGPQALDVEHAEAAEPAEPRPPWPGSSWRRTGAPTQRDARTGTRRAARRSTRRRRPGCGGSARWRCRPGGSRAARSCPARSRPRHAWGLQVVEGDGVSGSGSWAPRRSSGCRAGGSP